MNNNKMIWNVLIESPLSHRVVPPLLWVRHMYVGGARVGTCNYWYGHMVAIVCALLWVRLMYVGGAEVGSCNYLRQSI